MHNPKALMVFTEELLNLHRGQGMELFWRDTLTCPSEADYFEMISNKTGGLYRLALKLMQVEGTGDMYEARYFHIHYRSLKLEVV